MSPATFASLEKTTTRQRAKNSVILGVAPETCPPASESLDLSQRPTKQAAGDDSISLGVLALWRVVEKKYDYHPSNAAATTPWAELARVANAEHRIEECLKRGKSEAGLGASQVRNWLGWHHHQALSLIASWFLVEEARRGKKGGAGVDGAPGASGVGADLPPGQWLRYGGAEQPRANAVAGAERVGAAVSLQGT